MRFHISKRFTMSCAHHLRRVPEGHKCARHHGHTYAVEVHLSGPLLGQDGMLVDFGIIKEAIHGRFDHQDLNEVFKEMGIGDVETTAEQLASVFWDILDGDVLRLLNVGQEPSNWVRIEKLSVQEGEGGIAWLERE